MSNDLKKEFERVEAISDAAERGRALEVFLTKIFEKENIEYKGRYRPKGEEIDGAFFLHGRNYLIEAKWRKKPEPASSVYSFRGKIEGKLEGTLGIFWSINGYSENCIPTVIAGKTLNVILFDRSDLEAILENQVTFRDLLAEKIMVAGRYGLIFVPWSDIQKSGTIQQEIDKVFPKSSILAIVEGSYDATILTSLFNFCFNEHIRQQIQIATIPAGGKSNVVIRAPIYAMSLFSSPNVYCIVIVDRDYDTQEAIEKFRDSLAAVTGQNDSNLHLAVPNPTIWTWLGLDSNLPKPDLGDYLNTFDWNDAISKHSDLRDLVDFLKQIK